MNMTITPAEMKTLETRFMADNNVPGALLMERAALGVVEAIARHTDKGSVVFLCGPGNNGGDGYAAARLWAERGGTSHIIEITEDVHGDAGQAGRFRRPVVRSGYLRCGDAVCDDADAQGLYLRRLVPLRRR